MDKADVIVIGAGASGLMAARTLARAGKKVIVLEARDRIGGRIHSLDENMWGYPAQAGAEFVHGEAPLTRALMAEADLSYLPIEGERWSAPNCEFQLMDDIVPGQELMEQKLRELTEDLPVAQFLEHYFPGDEYAELRSNVYRIVQGYDAADPQRISTFALRDEWLEGQEWKQGRIKEGYGALLEFLFRECQRAGVEMRFNTPVQEIMNEKENVCVRGAHGFEMSAQAVVVTASVGALQNLRFTPVIQEEMRAVQDIGFGAAIKILLKFTDAWWLSHENGKLGNMSFLFSREIIPTWWTKHPEQKPILTGWLGGPPAEAFTKTSDDALLTIALRSLSNIFGRQEDDLRNNLVASHVANWAADQYVQGAYSYPTPQTDAARSIFAKPIHENLFFAGEALATDGTASTVEGAFVSGEKTAQNLIKILG